MSGKSKVYKDNNGNYVYRDTLHTGERAHLEVFNKQGIYMGEANPLTGIINPNTADPTKRVKW